MPKHVGLGLAMTMAQRKEIITLLNHHGHCINYWECEEGDTKWAEISLNQFEEEDGYYQPTLPSNIASGTFVQSAADNAHYLQDSVVGNQSVHVMSMVFYQGEFALDPQNLDFPAQKISKVRDKLYELAFTSKTPVPTFVKQVKANFFQQCALERERSYRGIESSLSVYQKYPSKAG